VDPGSDRPLYLQVVDEVRRELVRGNVAAGDALPSLRQLAADLRLNPNTVQQAYRELEREGIVWVRRGQGTYIRDDVQPHAQRALLVERVAREALAAAARSGVTGEELMEALGRHLPAADVMERSR
jgi:GntR family transcriptional regulator